MSTICTIKYNSFLGICIILLLFGSPNLFLAAQNIFKGDFYNALLDLFHFLITIGLFLFPLILFNCNIRKYLFIVSPIFAFVPVFIFIAAIYKKLPTRPMFYMLFEAQKIEISEFLTGIIIWKILVLIFPLLVILISTRIVQFKKTLNTKLRIQFIGFYLALFFLTFNYKLLQRKTINNTLEASYRTFIRDSPILVSIRFIKALKTYKTDIVNNYNNNYTCVYQKTEIKSREVYILVLGESSRYKNWGINGYPRNTSPKILAANNLISYKNIISPSFSTNKSVPIILTTQSTKNYDVEAKYTSIINLFKQAGFITYWIGNQSSKGNIIGSIAHSSHVIYESDQKKPAYFDGDLLPKIDEILDKKEQKTFIIIHTWGSHYPYQNRYPESFSVFTPALKRNEHIPLNTRQKNAIINSYDNTIAYTDFLLSRLIELINIDSALTSLTFISDHGENLFDDENIGFGRGYGKYSPQLFHIPLFFWASEKYISNNRLKWETLIKNDSVNCTTENFIYTYTDLAGIYWNNFDSTQSFASNYFRETERLFMDKKKFLNYDTFFINGRE